MAPDDNGESTFDVRTRRTVLRTLGAGSALAALGGTAAGGEHGGDGGRRGDDGGQSDGSEQHGCPPCIDELTGYASLTTELDLPGELMPDHTVELRMDDADVLFPEQADADGAAREEDTNDPEEIAEESGGFPDFYFDPVGLAVEVGDVVEFPNASADLHTVTAMHPRFFGLPQRIPEDAVPFTSPPFVGEENWLYRFTEPGVYDLLCLPHFELGMVMRVVVTRGGCPMPRAPGDVENVPPTVAAVLNADALHPQRIVEDGPVSWSDLNGQIPTFDGQEMFGEGGGPGGGSGGEGGDGGGEGEQ